jgi:hypothetical protein
LGAISFDKAFNNSCHPTLLQNVDGFITWMQVSDEAASCSTTENTTLEDCIWSKGNKVYICPATYVLNINLIYQ